MEQKWLRLSGAGEFRGEGQWQEVRDDIMEKYWAHCERTGFLPVAKSFPNHVRVYEKARPDVWPNYVIQDGWMIHQFHEVGVKVSGVGDQALQYAQRQVLNLIKSKLEIEHAEET
ncbi:hypothetical protein FDH38_gp122 [Dinoroseobacter phage vB_DshS-R5C]|uniref:Uncharacterized protein n=1 Tax=Dinoroseobacter phage vB_DshS-R5C TaxID=1965368 RepID=A0A1V0DYD5_9CAUD|nr:hypothetical protein FDH38_gp122 [Dinoroseobacter phage vB_DshS-R5C]ARB06176.1 hypothetical protein vBDshSR5C_122 [Dinoroseobacter phage vB_DshS-R5C]